MSVKGDWPRENCTLFDKFCWLYLGDLPENLRVRVGDDFDPNAFGWDGVRPGKAVEMAAAFEREAADGQGAHHETSDESVAAAAEQLRPLTFASREFWIIHTTFVANVICSFAVASFLAWNMDFFQMLMAPAAGDALDAAMNATVWLTTAMGAVAAWRMRNRPSYYSLPRVLTFSLAAFAAAELLVVDAIVYIDYFDLFGWFL